jgi:hypothetical protein
MRPSAARVRSRLAGASSLTAAINCMRGLSARCMYVYYSCPGTSLVCLLCIATVSEGERRRRRQREKRIRTEIGKKIKGRGVTKKEKKKRRRKYKERKDEGKIRKTVGTTSHADGKGERPHAPDVRQKVLVFGLPRTPRSLSLSFRRRLSLVSFFFFSFFPPRWTADGRREVRSTIDGAHLQPPSWRSHSHPDSYGTRATQVRRCRRQQIPASQGPSEPVGGWCVFFLCRG